MTKPSPTEPTSPDEEALWARLLARDRSAGFFYGVLTTGVYCHPWCPSRRPRRENVRFFSTQGEARAAGFRACLRCGRDSAAVVEQLRAHLEQNRDRAVSLAELGRRAGLSPFAAQRLFKAGMGVSPSAYQRSLRAGAMRQALRAGSRVTDAVYEAGYGSQSRAYEAGSLGMTPARFAAGGKGERIQWASAETGLGWVIAAATERGLCWLALAGSSPEAVEGLRAEFPAADLFENEEMLRWVEAALAVVRGESAALDANPLDLRGTAFQLRVWSALRRIPRGETVSYGQLAQQMGIPRSTRAVARACATNRVALMVPCHRVVGATGSLTGYRWGVERKRALLMAEREG